MFGLFKKNPRKKLETEYRQLMEESFKLSTIDRKASDAKRAEAELILEKLEKLNEIS